MDTNTVRRNLAQVAAVIRGKNPGMSVTICATLNYHHSNAEGFSCHIQVGHSEMVMAPTLEEAIRLIEDQGSPESKRRKAAELRREADALETAAVTQISTT